MGVRVWGFGFGVWGLGVGNWRRTSNRDWAVLAKHAHKLFLQPHHFALDVYSVHEELGAEI